jgi:hypothetical protein
MQETKSEALDAYLKKQTLEKDIKDKMNLSFK